MSIKHEPSSEDLNFVVVSLQVSSFKKLNVHTSKTMSRKYEPSSELLHVLEMCLG